jgi:hypothetical protein
MFLRRWRGVGGGACNGVQHGAAWGHGIQHFGIAAGVTRLSFGGPPREALYTVALRGVQQQLYGGVRESSEQPHHGSAQARLVLHVLIRLVVVVVLLRGASSGARLVQREDNGPVR